MRSRFFLSSKTKVNLNYTLIYLYRLMQLCLVNRMQKRALRAITNSDYRVHSFILQTRNLRCFPVNTFAIANFMFHYKKSIYFPHCFSIVFVTNSQIHCFGTRTATNVFVSYKSQAINNSLARS